MLTNKPVQPRAEFNEKRIVCSMTACQQVGQMMFKDVERASIEKTPSISRCVFGESSVDTDEIGAGIQQLLDNVAGARFDD